jgi:UDP:flavonoid glycosyltransferase YjiC (YdhE family)
MVTWDGAGTRPPQRALVRGLLTRGHSVHVIAGDSLRAAFDADGAEFHRLPQNLQWDAVASFKDEEIVSAICMAEGFGSELRLAVDRIKPDVLMIDNFMIKTLIAAKGSGVPTVLLNTTILGATTEIFGAIFEPLLGELNEYATMIGAPGFASVSALIDAADIQLVFSYREFDPIKPQSSKTVHVSPLRAVESTRTFRPEKSGRALVLASLSSGYQDQSALLQRICDALAQMPVDGIVTSGRAVDPEALIAGDNTKVFRFVAHEELLPSTDLLITHAGHGTVMAAVKFGVPMLCVPMGRDRPAIAARVMDPTGSRIFGKQ